MLKAIYTIEIDFIGYTAFFNAGITLNSAKPAITLNNIFLHKKSETLSAVVVTTKTQILENKIDKIVYNVDKDVTSQGGVATDALKKIPGVTVDIDGNVELLGTPAFAFNKWETI